MRNFRSRRILSAICSLVTLGYKPIGSANEMTGYQIGSRPGTWLIRVSAMKIKPMTQATDLPVIGGTITAPEKFSPGLDVSYFFADNWALEFQGGVFENSYRVEGSAIGSFPIGNIKTNTLSAVLQYHFKTPGPIKPYIGAGVNRAWSRSVEPAANRPDFNVRPITSTVLNAGVDVGLSRHWVLNASARYVLSPAYAFEGDGGKATARVNTLVMGAGIGFYF